MTGALRNSPAALWLLYCDVSTEYVRVSEGYRKKQIPYYSVHNVVIEFPNYVVVFFLSPLTNS